jgi:triosephosphate isomerase (TIM)
MRRKLVVGNWKMHGSKASAKALITDFRQHLSGNEKNCDVAVCPPAVLISYVADTLTGADIACGAQNVYDQAEGAFTGEISAQMLAEAGCRYVIIGHSERRTLFAETDADVAEKCVAAQSVGITPIICIGESLKQREAGQTLEWVEQQLQVVIDVIGITALEKAVIAYEPIWAIGTGKTATPEQAQEVHAHIRRVMAKANARVAEQARILYGGSVNAANAALLFEQGDIDGALVGGASLKAQDFAKICLAA